MTGLWRQLRLALGFLSRIPARAPAQAAPAPLTARDFDRGATAFDTPTLVELWRTAPYLHDGSAATVREVLIDRNKQDAHGKTSHLKPAEISDLVEYLLSL